MLKESHQVEVALCIMCKYICAQQQFEMLNQNLNKLHAEYALKQFEKFPLSELRLLKCRKIRQHAWYSHATTESIYIRDRPQRVGFFFYSE